MLSIAAPFNKAPRSRRATSRCATSPGSTSSTTRCSASSSPARRSRTTSSSRRGYFKQRRRHRARTRPTRSRTPSTPIAPGGTPDYNYDIMGGLDAALTYDIDIAKAGRVADHRPRVRRRAHRPRGAVRHRDQQLPAVRRRQLPARHDGAGRLQPAGRDPPADHRLGHGQQGHRPAPFSSLDWRLVSNGPRSRSPADRHTAGASVTPRLDGCGRRPSRPQPSSHGPTPATRAHPTTGGCAPRRCPQEPTSTW